MVSSPRSFRRVREKAAWEGFRIMTPSTAVRNDPRSLVAELRAAGLRATATRLALLAALRNDTRHPTAEQLHGSLRPEHPTLALSTVYDGLESFVRVGLGRRVATCDGRLRFDGHVEPHDHAACRECGSIEDVEISRFPRPGKLPILPGGMVADGMRVEYDVLCRACRSAG